MKKLLIGAFLTATFIVAGSINANAQNKMKTKVVDREASLKKEQQSKKRVETKRLNTTKVKKVANKKETPKNKKAVTKGMAKERLKKQPANLKPKKD